MVIFFNDGIPPVGFCQIVEYFGVSRFLIAIENKPFLKPRRVILFFSSALITRNIPFNSQKIIDSFVNTFRLFFNTLKQIDGIFLIEFFFFRDTCCTLCFKDLQLSKALIDRLLLIFFSNPFHLISENIIYPQCVRFDYLFMQRNGIYKYSHAAT